MGSSTAYGYFGSPAAYPRDSAWAFKVKKYYKDLGVIDTLFNIATNGIDCYTCMPTSYVPPPGRFLPDPQFNISRAVKLLPKPDVIIVNLPTNNYDWLDPYEVLACLKTIRDTALLNGIRCFITTTQPRDAFAPSQRLKLKELKRLIDSTFDVWSINFWTDIVDDPPLTIKSAYSLGDGTHLNPAGHTVLKNIVINKNIFSGALPLSFGALSGFVNGGNIIVKWKVYQESAVYRYEVERSTDGRNFTSTGSVFVSSGSPSEKQYSFTDIHPQTGMNYYRIAALSTGGHKQYSAILSVRFEKGYQIISNVYPAVSKGRFTVLLSSPRMVKTNISVTSTKGRKVYSASTNVNGDQLYTIDISNQSAGVYFLEASDGIHRQTWRIIKQ